MNIEEAKKYCKQIKDKDLWKIGYVYGGEAIETVLSELENKDKVINEMAEWLIGYTYSDEENLEAIFNNKEEVIEYFTNKVEREGK